MGGFDGDRALGVDQVGIVRPHQVFGFESFTFVVHQHDVVPRFQAASLVVVRAAVGLRVAAWRFRLPPMKLSLIHI